MRIGIIGVGNIGSILARKIHNRFSMDVGMLFLCDRFPEKLRDFADNDKVKISDDPEKVCEQSDVIFLAVKPQDADNLLSQIASIDFSEKAVVSTMTGISVSTIQKALDAKNVARIMPNIPIDIGKGVIALYFSDSFEKARRELILKLLDPLGTVITVNEKDFPAVTALSGSGPAFIFVIIEALIDVGLKMGLSYDTSRALILDMILGSVELLKVKGNHPGEFRHIVTSPGGTTIEGIYSPEREGLRGTIMKVLFDTYSRAIDISKKASGVDNT